VCVCVCSSGRLCQDGRGVFNINIFVILRYSNINNCAVYHVILNIINIFYIPTNFIYNLQGPMTFEDIYAT